MHCPSWNWGELVHLFGLECKEKEQDERGCHAATRKVTGQVGGAPAGHRGREPMGALPKSPRGFTHRGGLQGVMKRVWRGWIGKLVWGLGFPSASLCWD